MKDKQNIQSQTNIKNQGKPLTNYVGFVGIYFGLLSIVVSLIPSVRGFTPVFWTIAVILTIRGFIKEKQKWPAVVSLVVATFPIALLIFTLTIALVVFCALWLIGVLIAL